MHIVRDGRDVVCSLLERGWLAAGRAGVDDADLPYGARARFWVEPERVEEFERASDATRAAWAWRRTPSPPFARSRSVRSRSATRRCRMSRAIATHLGVPADAVRSAMAGAHSRSIGRFRRELTADQLADVERAAGSS